MMAAKRSKATKKMSSKRRSGESDGSKTIYMPIQQGSYEMTAEAIVVRSTQRSMPKFFRKKGGNLDDLGDNSLSW